MRYARGNPHQGRLREIILAWLDAGGHALRVEEIVDELKRSGRLPKGINPRTNVNAYLSENGWVFSRSARGEYALRDDWLRSPDGQSILAQWQMIREARARDLLQSATDEFRRRLCIIVDCMPRTAAAHVAETRLSQLEP